LRDTDGVVRYVGIGDAPTRGLVHARDFQKIGPYGIRKADLIQETIHDVGTLTKGQARGLEQLLIGRY